MNVESAFNMLVKLARANKLTFDEHQRVTEAIEIVLEALNEEKVHNEVQHLDDEKE